MATKMTREEAINTVRNIYQTDKEKEALGILIPELTESEDERIRKRLIEYFEGFRMGNAEVKWEGLNVQEVLVWLEKQKEQKHPNGCFTCDEYKKGYEEGRRNGFTAGYNKAMKEVEQKEQKPVVTHGETYHVDTLGTQQVIAGKMPQKPAEWSEEDEENLEKVIWYIEKGCKLIFQKPDKLISWLKSLRPQYHGDVAMTEAYKMGKEAGEASHWKPSEEQMKALNEIVNTLAASPFFHQNDYLFNILNGLREELKKLL